MGGPKLLWRAKRLAWATAYRLVDLLSPRDQRAWVFELGRDNAINGNLGAFLHFVASRGGITLTLVSASPGKVERRHLPAGARLLDLYSPAAALAFARSGAVFIHHGRIDACGRSLSRRRLLVNLWHGIPVKGLRHTASAAYSPVNDDDADTSAIIASSKVDTLAMAASFHLRFDKVWNTGLPRNDLFLGGNESLYPAARESFETAGRIKKGRRLVLYAPTFRGGVNVDYSSGVYAADEVERGKLIDLLSRHDAVLGIRTHGYFGERGCAPWEFGERVVDLGAAVAPDANGLLLATDVLVTDYSSIWIDYLLTDRPIIGFIHDRASYDHDRGTIYEYGEIFPGPLHVDFPGLLKSLETALSGGETGGALRARRERARRLFFSHPDASASRRVFGRVEAVLGTVPGTGAVTA